MNIPIIALSQLSRAVETRKESKIPQLSDLRESGAIEQDADMVMFIYRPEYYEVNSNEQGESTKGETHIRIAKHRNGSLENIVLQAHLHIQRFEEMDNNKFGGSGGGFPSGGNFKPIPTGPLSPLGGTPSGTSAAGGSDNSGGRFLKFNFDLFFYVSFTYRCSSLLM